MEVCEKTASRRQLIWVIWLEKGDVTQRMDVYFHWGFTGLLGGLCWCLTFWVRLCWFFLLLHIRTEPLLLLVPARREVCTLCLCWNCSCCFFLLVKGRGLYIETPGLRAFWYRTIDALLSCNSAKCKTRVQSIFALNLGSQLKNECWGIPDWDCS